MSTKGSRRRTAIEAAKAESTSRYPGDDSKSRSLRIGFVAGVMWHREHPWHDDAQPSESEREPSGLPK